MRPAQSSGGLQRVGSGGLAAVANPAEVLPQPGQHLLPPVLASRPLNAAPIMPPAMLHYILEWSEHMSGQVG